MVYLWNWAANGFLLCPFYFFLFFCCFSSPFFFSKRGPADPYYRLDITILRFFVFLQRNKSKQIVLCAKIILCNKGEYHISLMVIKDYLFL